MKINVKKVREEILKSGLDARRLSTESGVAENTLYRMLRGDTADCYKKTVEKLAAAFGVGVEELLIKGDKEMQTFEENPMVPCREATQKIEMRDTPTVTIGKDTIRYVEVDGQKRVSRADFLKFSGVSAKGHCDNDRVRTIPPQESTYIKIGKAVLPAVFVSRKWIELYIEPLSFFRKQKYLRGLQLLDEHLWHLKPAQEPLPLNEPEPLAEPKPLDEELIAERISELVCERVKNFLNEYFGV